MDTNKTAIIQILFGSTYCLESGLNVTTECNTGKNKKWIEIEINME